MAECEDTVQYFLPSEEQAIVRNFDALIVSRMRRGRSHQLDALNAHVQRLALALQLLYPEEDDG